MSTLLSDAEVSRRADSLCRILREIDRENETWKAATREHKDAIENLEKSAGTLRREIEIRQSQAEQEPLDFGVLEEAEYQAALAAPTIQVGEAILAEVEAVTRQYVPKTDAEEEAFEAGADAQVEGAPEGSCPYPLTAPTRSLRLAWLAGWNSENEIEGVPV